MGKLDYDIYSKTKIGLHFRLDHSDIPHILKAEITEDERITTGRKKTAFENVKLSLVEGNSVAFYEDDKKFQKTKDVMTAFRAYDQRIKKVKETKNKVESKSTSLSRLNKMNSSISTLARTRLPKSRSRLQLLL